MKSLYSTTWPRIKNSKKHIAQAPCACVDEAASQVTENVICLMYSILTPLVVVPVLM